MYHELFAMKIKFDHLGKVKREETNAWAKNKMNLCLRIEASNGYAF